MILGLKYPGSKAKSWTLLMKILYQKTMKESINTKVELFEALIIEMQNFSKHNEIEFLVFTESGSEEETELDK